MDVATEERLADLEATTRSLTERMEQVEARAWLRPQASVVPASDWPVSAQPLSHRPIVTRRVSDPAVSTEPTATTSSTAAPESARQTVGAAEWFDELLGGRMLAWLGGVAVVVGIALFFTYAVSRGWLGPWARVGCGAAGSCGLLWFGLRPHARGGRTEAARTLVAVALSGLFMTVVVASRVYGLIPAVVGLALAIGVGATATLLAVSWNARVIAALGIVGALLSPMIVGAPDDLATLMILAAAAASAVGVLVWRRWDWLAFGALLACVIQWLPWSLSESVHPGLVPVLLVLVGFGVIGHLTAIGFELRMPQASLRWCSSLLLTLNCAVLAIGGSIAVTQAGSVLAGQLWIAGVALVHLGLALAARRGRRVCADVALLLFTLAMLLSDAAFAVLASGPVLAVGWAFTGAAFAYLYSRRTHPGHGRQMAGAGLGGHLFSGLIVAISQPGQLTFDGAAGTGGVLAVAAIAAGTIVSGQLTGSVHRCWRDSLNAVGLALIAYLTAVTLSGTDLVLTWALEAVAVAAVARRTRDQVAAVASLLFLAGSGIYAGSFDTPPRGLVFGVPHLAAAALALGVVAAATLGVARMRLHVLGRQTAPGLVASGLLTLLYLASVAIITAFQPHDPAVGFSGLDLATRQQGQLALSALWGGVGVAALIVGLRQDLRLLRLGALALLLATAAKVSIYDLSKLDSIYRVSSFIAVGLLLLAGAHAYQRLQPHAARR